MIKNISNLGDAALYCDFGKEVDKDTNTKVIKYFRSIKKEKIDGINNLTPSYNKLIISFDLKKTNYTKVKKLIENPQFENRQVYCERSDTQKNCKPLVIVENVTDFQVVLKYINGG